MKSCGKGDLGILLSCCFARCKGEVLPAPRGTALVFGKPVVLQTFPGEELPLPPWLSQLSQHLPFDQQDWQLACKNSQEENIWKTSAFDRLHPKLSWIHAFFSILFVYMLPLQPLTQLSDRFGTETPLSGDHTGKDPTLHKGFASKLLPVVAPKFLRLQGDSKLVHIWLAVVSKEKVFAFMTQLCSTFPSSAEPTIQLTNPPRSNQETFQRIILTCIKNT